MTPPMTPEERAEKRYVIIENDGFFQCNGQMCRYRYDMEYYAEVIRDGYATCLREEVDPLEKERDAVDAILNHRAMGLSMPDAVQWLHKDHGSMCEMLQLCAQRHKLGLGGENVAQVAVDAIDELASKLAEQDKLIRQLVEAGKAIYGQVLHDSECPAKRGYECDCGKVEAQTRWNTALSAAKELGYTDDPTK